MRRHLAFAALAVLFISTTTGFGAKQPRNYSSADVDRLLDQLRTELLSKIPPKLPAEPTPPPAALAVPQGYSKAEVDDLLAKLRADIEQHVVTKSDIDQAIQPFVTNQQLDDANAAAKLREKAIEDKLRPPFPAWISPLLSLVAIICSIAIPLWSRRNTVQDHATVRANALRDAAEDRAREYVNEWQEHVGNYASAMDLLRNGAPITEPADLNLIVRMGNLVDRLAAGVSRGTTDGDIITVSGLKRHAMDFKAALEPRQEQAIINNLAQWDNLRRWH